MINQNGQSFWSVNIRWWEERLMLIQDQRFCCSPSFMGWTCITVTQRNNICIAIRVVSPCTFLAPTTRQLGLRPRSTKWLGLHVTFDELPRFSTLLWLVVSLNWNSPAQHILLHFHWLSISKTKFILNKFIFYKID